MAPPAHNIPFVCNINLLEKLKPESKKIAINHKIKPIILYTLRLSHKILVPIAKIKIEEISLIETSEKETSKYFNAVSIPRGAKKSKDHIMSADFNSKSVISVVLFKK